MTLITERIDWAGSEERWEEKENEFSNMLRQKARIRWDVEGDENSKFFHSYIKRRNNKSNIRGLMINGIGVEDPKLIKWKWRDIQTSVYGRGATVHQSSGYKELLPMENAGWLMDIRRVVGVACIIITIGEELDRLVSGLSKHSIQRIDISCITYIDERRLCWRTKGPWANTWLAMGMDWGQMEIDTKRRWKFFGQRSFNISRGEDSRRGNRRSRNDMKQVGA
ncbi:hypothetical protein Tco_1217289 [Tanacetum coccineum]